ncbi:hypothetical protein [Marinimicrobium sp. ABcell2]|uniref:hypothetical protein n=1 Tax=Marinimicrobium sp. ABcell2 TaxID=3069751 RepID=UPI0027B5F1DD|nr:hypothetical protein [Marinimicrobium sp. ABcell2]MDQ2076421.1 hypothetical protein [Marinimicrobium sp. ABcell2]
MSPPRSRTLLLSLLLSFVWGADAQRVYASTEGASHWASASDNGPSDEYIPPLDDSDPQSDSVSSDNNDLPTEVARLHAENILAERDRLGVPTHHKDYPLVPGCEPVDGSRVLPAADLTHHLVSRGVCLPAQWIDGLFAGPEGDPYAARTLFRVIYAPRWQQEELHLAGTRFDGQVSLHHISNKLSLILRSDDKDDDLLRERLDLERPDDRGMSRAALRWATALGRHASSGTDVGLRGSTAFVRTRFRYNQRLFWDIHSRLNQEFYWRDNQERRGYVTELQLGRVLTENTTLRLTSTAESNSALRQQDTGSGNKASAISGGWPTERAFKRFYVLRGSMTAVTGWRTISSASGTVAVYGGRGCIMKLSPLLYS